MAKGKRLIVEDGVRKMTKNWSWIDWCVVYFLRFQKMQNLTRYCGNPRLIAVVADIAVRLRPRRPRLMPL